jgi:hypothetical protein
MESVAQQPEREQDKNGPAKVPGAPDLAFEIWDRKNSTSEPF